MKTNKLLIIVAAMIFGMGAYAQDDFETVVKSGNGEVEHGGYGAVRIGYTQIDGLSALTSGVRGVWIINHKFALGGGASGFINDLSPNNGSNEYFIGGGYGGFVFEPILFPNKAFHVTFPILIGGGMSATMRRYHGDNYHDDNIYDYGGYFVFEPAVELEMNMVKFFRMAAGVSYRLTSNPGISYPYREISSTAFNYFNFYLIFKFGKF